MLELMALCGIDTAFAPPEGEDEWGVEGPSASGEAVVHALREGARKRARSTIAPDRASTALAWLFDYLVATRRVPYELHGSTSGARLTSYILHLTSHFLHLTSYVPFAPRLTPYSFKPLRFAGDLERSQYNYDTLEQLAEYIRRRGSRQKGREGSEIASDTIDGYISTIKTIARLESRSQFIIDGDDFVLSAAAKATRRAQPAKGERALKRGIRAQHFRRLIALGFHRGSHRRTIEWAAGLLSWNILLRGGEIGVVPGKSFDSSRDLSFGAFEFMAPSPESQWMPWLHVWTCPIKDGEARRRSEPIAIRRRHTGPLGAEPLCVYDAIIAAWRAQSSTPPPQVGRVTGRLANRPFFTAPWRAHICVSKVGQACCPSVPVWNTEDTRALACLIARTLELDPSEFGGKSFRIGGATDWRAKLGADSERLIRQRGRWRSDVALAYQRSLVEQHLESSVAVGDISSADLEAVCPGWVQRA